jgi:hypothetical protein
MENFSVSCLLWLSTQHSTGTTFFIHPSSLAVTQYGYAYEHLALKNTWSIQ